MYINILACLIFNTDCYHEIVLLDSLKKCPFSTFPNLKRLNERQSLLHCHVYVTFVATYLRWIIFKSFHSQASHLPSVYWRHYSYKWTFVLKECRVCRRVGGWEGAAAWLCVKDSFLSWIKPFTKLSSAKKSKLKWKVLNEENILTFFYCISVLLHWPCIRSNAKNTFQPKKFDFDVNIN